MAEDKRQALPQSQGSAVPQTQGVFVRDATGLVKEFGTKEAFLIATALIWALLYTVVQFPWYFGFWQGANLPVALLVASVPWIIFLIPYWAIGVLMPRSGNDYVWIGRIMSPALALAWSMVYTIGFYLSSMSNNFAMVSIVGSYLSLQGIIANNSGLANFGASLGTPLGTFLATLLLIAGFAAFAIVGTKSIKRLIYVTWVVTIVGFALIMVIFSGVTPATFATKWDGLLANFVSYQGIMDTARKGGWSIPTVTIATSIASIPFASLFLFGGQNTNIVAGEMKNVRRSIPVMLILSLFASVAIWIAVVTVELNAVGYNWMAAVGYLFDGLGSNGASLSSLPSAPSTTLFMSVIAYPNQILMTLIPLTFFIGSLGGQFLYWWIPSRYFFAWSFDRVIPSRFADVNSRFGSPHYSILLLVVLSASVAALLSFIGPTGYSVLFSLGTFLWGGAYIIPMLAAAIFPFIRKDLVPALPGFLKYKVGGITVVTLISALGVALSVWEDYLYLTNPALNVISVSAVLGVAGIVILGIVIYYSSVYYHKSRGIDIRQAFKEIPPE